MVKIYKLLTSWKWLHCLSLTTCDHAFLPSFLLNQRELELRLQCGQSSWQNVLMPAGLTVLQGLEFLFCFLQLLAVWCAEQWFPETYTSLPHPAQKCFKFSKTCFVWAWSLVLHCKERAPIEHIWEQYADALQGWRKLYIKVLLLQRSDE